MAQQTLPVNPMFQNQQIDSTINSDTTLVDPITKCKDLLPQLKQSLLTLMQQLVIVMSPNSDNKNVTENQFQLLGKHVENFDRVCDLLIINLRVAHEVQQVLTMLQTYERLDQRDQQRPDPARNMSDSVVNKHVSRIIEIRSSLQRYLAPKTEQML